MGTPEDAKTDMMQPVVLEISSAMQVGGGEVHFVNLIAGLSQRHFDISAVVRPQSPLIPKLLAIPVPVYTLPLRNSLDFYSALRLHRLAKHLGVHILHAHVARDYLMAALARGGGRHLVLTRHLLLPLHHSPLHRVCFRLVDRFIAVSHGVKQELLRHNGIDPERVIVIPNGVPVERFNTSRERGKLRNELGIPFEKRVVGIVGQIAPHKGHEDFVEAAAIISSRFPEIVYLVVGEESGDGSFCRRLRSSIIQKGLEKNFIFAGFLEDIPSAMGIIDVLAVPSWEEPFGMVVLEAMAAGVPVVATNAGGPAEILGNGHSGLLIAPRAPRELAEAICSVLSNHELRDRLSRHGRERVEQHYSLELQVQRTADMFHELGARS